MANQSTVPAPPIQEPISGPNGRLSPLWANWFNKFYQRSGSGEVTPTDDLEAQQAYDFDTIPASVARETVDNQIIDNLANENKRRPFEQPVPGILNPVINGGCMSSSRASASITTSFAYGPVDLIAVKADGTVGAGTVAQATSSTLTETEHACSVTGCTLTGSGAVYFRHRIEAKDAVRFVDKIVNFSCRAYHDIGSAKNAVVTINKADSADNFGSTTEIATATIAVPDQSNHTVETVIVDMGDCSNGIEIEIKIDTGAITTKNIYCGDIQLSIGADRRDFEIRPLSFEKHLVRRYLYPCVAFMGVANSASNMQVPLLHPGMRAAPSYAATGALNMTDCIAADFAQSSADVNTTHENTADNGRVSIGLFTGLTSGRVHIHRGTSTKILASSEL